MSPHEAKILRYETGFYPFSLKVRIPEEIVKDPDVYNIEIILK